jgi:protein-S-isoprenylcysteine O-methyltransferase Ste14
MEATAPAGAIVIIRLVIQTLAWVGTVGALLFLAAGTVHWPEAWIFLIGFVVLSLGLGLSLGRRDPDLVRERLRLPIQKRQKAADRILLTALMLLMYAWFAFMALDAVRFGWSRVPHWVEGLGALGILLSTWIGYRALRANPFAAPVVKIQKERGHRIVTTGPYRYVRHPMYGGALLWFIGLPLLLGSWWGLAVAPVFAVLLVIRIRIEEQALSSELPGYAAYAEQVRYRLIPLIW